MTGAKPLLSILVPVYNVAPYLAECIHSIFEQQPEYPLEVIMLDDGSDDGSNIIAEELCDRFCGSLTLLRHTENRGLSAARNTLLESACGEYIWFLDSDDKLLPPSLDRLGAIFQTDSPDLILCDYCKNNQQQIASFEGLSGTLNHDITALVRGVFAKRALHAWSKISRRELWSNDLRFPEGRMFEDIATIPQLLLRTKSYVYAAENWLFYRQREQSITRRVRNAPDFDKCGHDDFAGALKGFMPAVSGTLGPVCGNTQFAIAHFQAKIFRQTGFTVIQKVGLRGGLREMITLINHYRQITEPASPIGYRRLLVEYAKRRQFKSLLHLWFFCILASGQQSSQISR